MKKVDVLVICLSSPLMIGVYENNKLIDKIEGKEKTSDELPLIFKKILENYHLENIFYTNGPGSYLSIKISYIFLKTISILKNINFFSISGFEFNQNSPIKALGKKYFIKNGDKIDTDFLSKDIKIFPSVLPKILEKSRFSKDNLPNYNLPVIS